MDEQEIQRKRRQSEEEATASRARLLGLPYLDTREFEKTSPLVFNLLKVDQMHRDFILPLQKGGGATEYQYMITSQTPRTLISEMRQQHTDKGERAAFFLISDSACKCLCFVDDPPKEVRHEDIKISTEGDSATMESVSKTLHAVAPDKVLDFLLEQADKLTASDIHIENLRDKIRIRMRVDGILHPWPTLTKIVTALLWANYLLAPAFPPLPPPLNLAICKKTFSKTAHPTFSIFVWKPSPLCTAKMRFCASLILMKLYSI